MRQKKKEFEVWFNEFYGKGSGSNLAGNAFVKAVDFHEAEKFAWEDFRTQVWKSVKFGDIKEYEEADPIGRMKCWTVNFSMKGKHGTYHGTAMPYAANERSAKNKTLRDLKRGGITVYDDDSEITAAERIGIESKG